GACGPHAPEQAGPLRRAGRRGRTGHARRRAHHRRRAALAAWRCRADGRAGAASPDPDPRRSGVATVTHLALLGPTASGKSALALGAAHSLRDVEIVSLDSMQVYRGLDIGTAKPTVAERAMVPHHLVDVVDPTEEWSAVRHQAAARAAVAAIEARGKRGLLVGGTGLYVQAVVDDLRFPGEDPDLRAELDAWTGGPGVGAGAYGDLPR